MSDIKERDKRWASVIEIVDEYGDINETVICYAKPSDVLADVLAEWGENGERWVAGAYAGNERAPVEKRSYCSIAMIQHVMSDGKLAHNGDLEFSAESYGDKWSSEPAVKAVADEIVKRIELARKAVERNHGGLYDLDDPDEKRLYEERLDRLVSMESEFRNRITAGVEMNALIEFNDTYASYVAESESGPGQVTDRGVFQVIKEVYTSAMHRLRDEGK